MTPPSSPAPRAPSRELDAEIAERVMGYRWYWHRVAASGEVVKYLALTPLASDHAPLSGDGTGVRERVGMSLPAYSTDIAATWQVVEKMRATGTHGREVRLDTADHDEWTCQVWDDPEDNAIGWATASTAPLAICLAALTLAAPRAPLEGE